ncbi:hypothetical protein COV19_07115 [Candidatus Woesearchaeota archaeon CG10_big_fil_rev_8_21_14_0_10_44_13]|nr:MAG: hypothetical protein COV19_07115 [Candidatus Woesearchaeota archaeon CG10_big_fil_rev_8_21_14_0_10_44_13]
MAKMTFKIKKHSYDPKILFVIVSWDSEKYIKSCLSSLFKLEYNNYKVLLIDNASSDKTLDYAKGYGLIVMKNKKNRGLQKANNNGLKYSINKGFDYTFFLNVDTIITDRNMLHLILNYFNNDKSTAIVFPTSYLLDNQDKKIFESFWLLKIINSLKLAKWNSMVDGCAMMIDNNKAKEIGYFDERLFYFDDFDYGKRARLKGFKTKRADNVKILHKWGGTIKHSLSPFVIYNFNNSLYIFLKKHLSFKFLFLLLLYFVWLIILFFYLIISASFKMINSQENNNSRFKSFFYLLKSIGSKGLGQKLNFSG